MKNWFLTLLLAMGAAVAAPVASVAANVGVLDPQEVMRNSNAGKRLQTSLERSRESAQKRIADMESKFLKQQEELARKKSILTPEKYLEEEAALKRAARDARVEIQGLEDKFDRELTIGRKEILDAVVAVVGEIAAARKFDVVLNKNQLVFSSNAVDITAEVLKKVNERLDKRGN
jgi:outer membrane protein